MDALLTEYLPFIRQEAGRQGGLGLEYDDRVSLGLSAFMRSVQQYDPGRGSFMGYAATSIRNALIDEAKKQSRHAQNTIPLEQEEDDGKTISFQYQAAAREHERQVENAALAEEIDLLEADLAPFDITLDSLDTISPKHRRVCLQCVAAARLLAQDGGAVQAMVRTKQLPVSALAQQTGVPAKTIAKFRKYIITVTLVYWHGYTGIERFFPKEEGV